MSFFKKIGVYLRDNKYIIFLSLLAAILVAGLVFQFVQYSSLNSAANTSKALKDGQRIIVDLQDAKWFEPNALTAEVIEEKVKFSADSDSGMDDEDVIDDVINDADDLEDRNESDDDAFSRQQLEEAAKKDAAKKEASDPKKPKIKILDKPALNESFAEISIIITNLGLNEKAIKSAMLMDEGFTMSFTPYGQQTTKSSVQLAEEGHAVLAELPMQSTVVREDAGKFGLSPTNEEQKNIQNFEAVYSIIPSASGFVTPVEEDFSGTGGGESLDKILKLIQDKNAAVIYRGKSVREVREFAAVNGLEAIIPDLTIDAQPSAQNIEAQLRALEMIAQERGSAVGIARPYPITFEILKKWQETLAEKKIKLVSVVR